ncbi:hypothetical protein BROUX41_003301 [Berkeleyomyces rouxiae]
MLSHLRFHRRGVSSPTSPTLPAAPVPDGQPSSSQRSHGLTHGQAPSQMQSHSQGNSPYFQSHAQFQPQPQPHSQSHSRTSSPHRSKTKSLFLSPSSFSGSSTFDATPFYSSSSKPQDAPNDMSSIKSPKQPVSSTVPSPAPEDSPPTGFMGGLALLKYQTRRHQTSAAAAANTAAIRLGAGPENTSSSYTPNGTTAIATSSGSIPYETLTQAPPPLINTNINVNFSVGRYSLPAQPSPGFAPSPSSAILSPSYNDRSPSFVTPTDIKNQIEMQKQQQQQGNPYAALGNNGGSGMGPMTTISASGPIPGSEKQHAPPKKTKGITFLRPVSTLLLRRKGNNSVPDLLPLGRVAEEPAYDPRIKGTRVHDFSAPRPKRTPNSAVTPQTQPLHSAIETSGGLNVYDSIKLSTSASTSTLVGPPENMASLDLAPNVAPSKDATSLPASLHTVPSTTSMSKLSIEKGEPTPQEHNRAPSLKSRISRKISMSEMSLHSSISRRMKSTSSRFSFDMIGAAKQEKIMEERHRQRQLEKGEVPEEPGEVNAFVQGDDRFDDFDMDDYDYDNMMDEDGFEEEIPGLNLDYDEDDIIEEEEHEDPFEYDEQYLGTKNHETGDSGHADIAREGLGHLTLADLEAAEAKEASPSQATVAVPVECPIETSIQEPIQDTPQDIEPPAVSEAQVEPQIIEQIIETPSLCSNRPVVAATSKRDSQNFAAFIFQRSNPASQLASPRSLGAQATPRDAEGRVIGFAFSNETPPGTGKSLGGWGFHPESPGRPAPESIPEMSIDSVADVPKAPQEVQEVEKPSDEPHVQAEESSSNLHVRINSPLSSVGEPEVEAVPLEMQEQFQMRASANERLGVLDKEEPAFDSNISNEFADEFITNEFTTGDDAGFDESIFDIDDTDQYGRPIPGAFATAQQRLMENRERLKRSSGALEGQQDTSNPLIQENDTRPVLHPITIPNFYPIHGAEGTQKISPETAAGHDTNIAIALQPMGLRNEIRGIGPETRPEEVMAYQAALAAAAQKAADAGKFKRDSWLSEAEEGSSRDKSSFREETGTNDVGQDDVEDLDLVGGFNMADYENDDMDDYFDFDAEDDSKIIEEANASALANDYDGWYGQEFGFYSAPLNQAHQLNSAVKYEYSNGGFFGPAGMSTISRSDSGRVAVREPNLTPITERSEYSNRNSIMSLPGITLPTSAITSPGLSQLAMIADNEESMSMSMLLRLRSRAWGGSQASSNHGSPRSERADGASSPLASFVGVSSGLNEHLHAMSLSSGRDTEVEGTSPQSNARASISGLAAGVASLRMPFSPSSAAAPATTHGQSQATTAGFPPAREFPLVAGTAPTSASPASLTLNTTMLSPGAGPSSSGLGPLPDLKEEEENDEDIKRA